MSEENVEVVREGYEVWQRSRQLDFDLLHPEIDWVMHGTPAGDVTYRGRDGVRRWFAEQDDAWSDQWWEVEDVRETPDGRVLALIIAHAVGRGSDVPVSCPWRTSGRSRKAEPPASRYSSTEQQPSKPPGCGSRSLTASRRAPSPARRSLSVRLLTSDPPPPA
jgi:ketosteroid isomerase-like protein